MDYCKQIVDFRKAYKTLRYAKNDMKIWELIKWSNKWCAENHIPKDLTVCFSTLVVAYADAELNESYLKECFEKINRKK